MLKELSEDLNGIKKIQSETKYILIEIKNKLQGNNRVDEAKNQINDLEHKKTKNNQSEQQEEKRIPPQNEYSINSLWDFKRSNIHIIGVPKGEQEEIGNLKKKIMKTSLIW